MTAAKHILVALAFVLLAGCVVREDAAGGGFDRGQGEYRDQGRDQQQERGPDRANEPDRNNYQYR